MTAVLPRIWMSQVSAIVRLELKKTLLARRGLWIYLLAFGPALLFAGHSLVQIKTCRACDIGSDTHIFAGVFQLLFLRLSIFFGCVGIFMNLFRGEVLDKSLHYYFLSPVKRPVLVAGKFLSGLLASMLIFGTSIVLQFFGLYWHFDSNVRQGYFFHGHGLEHLTAYVGVTLLACVGYGGLFLLAGVLFPQSAVSDRHRAGLGGDQRLPAATASALQRDLLSEVALSGRRARRDLHGQGESTRLPGGES